MSKAATGNIVPVRCAIYTRKSTAQGLDQDFNSLDAQREACELYIRNHASEGWDVAPDTYSDGGFTGANLERPGFGQLLADIDAGLIDVVVVYKVDRLSRSLLDFAKVMDRFNGAGVAFVSVTQNFSTADAMGRLTLNMLMSFAEFEREMIAERTRDKIVAARRRGKWTGGPVPLGYDIVDKQLVVNEVEATIVREIFALYLEFDSPLAVVERLHARGRPTKRYVTQAGVERQTKPWDKPSILRVLSNPIYAGWMAYKDERFEGQHQAIIGRDQFRLVQAVLKRKRKHAKKHRGDHYLLGGLIRCACCGAAYTTASTRKQGNVYRYYRCVTRDKNGRDACPAKPLAADAIEDFVVGRIREAIASAENPARLAAPVRERIEFRRRALIDEQHTLAKNIPKLAAEVERRSAPLAQTTGDARKRAEQHLDAAMTKLDAAQAWLLDVERRIEALTVAEAEADWVEQTLSNFSDLWEVMTPINRRRLIEALMQEILVDEPAGRIEARMGNLSVEVENDADSPESAEIEINTTFADKEVSSWNPI